MENFSGLIVDYMINAPCNLHCPFCYGPDPHLKGEIKLSQKYTLLENLKAVNVKKIVIAGGEPSLDKDLFDFCRYASELEIGLSLQTNGTLVEKFLKVLPYLDWIALPLDGISEMSQFIMRTDMLHFERFQKAIEAVNNYKNTYRPSLNVKIGTVVSRHNIKELYQIAEILSKLNVSVWKLYKIRHRGKGCESNTELSIDDEESLSNVSLLKKDFNNLNIHYSADESQSDSYIIIDPDASIYTITGRQQQTFGKLFTDVGLFDMEKLKSVLDYSQRTLILNNINKSFPGWLSK